MKTEITHQVQWSDGSVETIYTSVVEDNGDHLKFVHPDGRLVSIRSRSRRPDELVPASSPGMVAYQPYDGPTTVVATLRYRLIARAWSPGEYLQVLGYTLTDGLPPAECGFPSCEITTHTR